MYSGGIDIFMPGTKLGAALIPPNPENKPATESLAAGSCADVTIGNPSGRVRPDNPL